jgi:pimeloyl-ACP methyl ester carboxylesterase
LLLLHGSGPGVTDWRNFRGNLPALAAHFRCLVLEFPGFGVSDDTGEHPMLAAGAAVTRLLDGLGIERAAVIGNSMGGIVGLRRVEGGRRARAGPSFVLLLILRPL